MTPEPCNAHNLNKICRVPSCGRLGSPTKCGTCGAKKRRQLCGKHNKKNRDRHKLGLASKY